MSFQTEEEQEVNAIFGSFNSFSSELTKITLGDRLQDEATVNVIVLLHPMKQRSKDKSSRYQNTSVIKEAILYLSDSKEIHIIGSNIDGYIKY